jgi:hypothetical protein
VAGTTFAEHPPPEIHGELPPGAKIAFIANDDFSMIEFRPLLGDDPIAAALATEGGAAAVSNDLFSFRNATGTDLSGFTLRGSVDLGGVIGS